MSFKLHERLAADTIFVTDWELSRVLLMNDARYPWLILVTRRDGLSELHDLTDSDAQTLQAEMHRASANLKTLTGAAKINIGALGNLVPQLHIHVVAREAGDAAWPGPVWGHGTGEPYSALAREAQLAALRKSL